MDKRYDLNTDNLVELTQDYFDEVIKQLQSISLHYKNKSPIEYKNWHNDYFVEVTPNA